MRPFPALRGRARPSLLLIPRPALNANAGRRKLPAFVVCSGPVSGPALIRRLYQPGYQLVAARLAFATVLAPAFAAAFAVTCAAVGTPGVALQPPVDSA